MHNLFLCPIHICEGNNFVEISALIELIVRRIIHIWTYLVFRRGCLANDLLTAITRSSRARLGERNIVPRGRNHWGSFDNDRVSKINRIFPQLASSDFWPLYSRILANRIEQANGRDRVSFQDWPYLSFFPSKARFLVTTTRHVTATTAAIFVTCHHSQPSTCRGAGVQVWMPVRAETHRPPAYPQPLPVSFLGGLYIISRPIQVLLLLSMPWRIEAKNSWL